MLCTYYDKSCDSREVFESNVWSTSFYNCLYVNVENTVKKNCNYADTALVTTEDRMIISSGIERLRLNGNGISSGLTQEYLFLVLSTSEIGSMVKLEES